MAISRTYRRRWDWVLILSVLVLVAAGMLAVYSATFHPESPRHGYFWRHAVAFLLGLGVFGVCLFLPLRLLEDWSWLFYGASIALLILVLVLGVEEYGARRWFRAGPIRFQPSEFAKLATVVVLARYLSGKRIDLARIRDLSAAVGLVALPMLLVLKEPDLGTAGAFIGLAVPMLMWGGIPRVILFCMVSPLLTLSLVHHWALWALFLVASAVYFWRGRFSPVVLAVFLAVQAGLFFGAPHVMAQLKPYQQARITSFLNPEADPAGSGYQVLQSKIAIGSGEWIGKGYLKGTQNILSFLPQQHTDFIYSVVGEEWGFMGSAAVIFFFGLLILRAIAVARNNRSPFGSFLLVGVSGLIFYHAALNMAMTMGLFPVTGLPLPFMSYGGSFLLTMMAGMGLMENVAVHRYDY